MPEQKFELARSDRRPSLTDSSSRRRPSPDRSQGYAPDPFLLTISGVLLFVVFMLVLVFRTLYPGGA
jgi:hypothetical protein